MPTDRLLHVAFYTDELDADPKVITDFSWQELVSLLTDSEASPCTITDGPLKCKGRKCQYKSHSIHVGNYMGWSPVEIEGPRNDKNVKSLSLLVLDFDHLTQDEAADIEEKLSSYEYILHTTHNHRLEDTANKIKEDICFRVVIYLSRDVPVGQWHRFYRYVVEFLHVPADISCANPSRFYFQPSHPQDAPFATEHHEGVALDVDEVLAWGEARVNSTKPGSDLPPLIPVDPDAMPEDEPIDLGALRRHVQQLVSRKGRSTDREDRIKAVLLRRLIEGKALALPSGVGDLETVRDGAHDGVGRDEAIHKTMGCLGFAFPTDTPWDAVRELVRASITAIQAVEGEDWLAKAEYSFTRSQEKRIERDRERAERERYHNEVLFPRLNARVASSPPSGDAPSPSASESGVPSGDGATQAVNGENWTDFLQKNGNGIPLAIPFNVSVVLEYDPVLNSSFRWNEVAKRVEFSGSFLARFAKHPIESVVTYIQDYMARTHHVCANYQDLVRRIVRQARLRPYDPITEYLNGLKWDGVSRVDAWLVRYAGAEDSYYTRIIGRKWLMGLIARAMQPGCKFDNVLMFEGLTGLGKSKIFKIIGGQWFSDTELTLGDKDSRMLAGRYWLYEIAELASFRKADSNALKTFFSSATDIFRPPYHADIEEAPRRAVFVGTTNDVQYLTDETGNRRYWCVSCKYAPEAIKALEQDRDQLLAEAVVIYRQGVERGHVDIMDRWWFEFGEQNITEDEADKRLVDVSAKTKIQQWWFGQNPNQRPSSVTTTMIAESVLEIKGAQLSPLVLKQIGFVLTKMGFERSREQSSGVRLIKYVATDELLTAAKEDFSGRRILKLVPSVSDPVVKKPA